MKPDHFEKVHLGPGSSHPSAQRWLRVRIQLAAALPLLGLLLAGLFAAADHRALLDWARNAPEVATAVACAAVFLLSALLSLALSARWSEVKVERRIRGSRRWDFLDPRVVAIAFVLGVLGPVLLARSPALPPSLRFAFQLFAFFPMVGLMFALQFARRPDAKGAALQRPILFALLTLVLALLGVTVAHDLALAWDRAELAETLRRVIPFYQSAERPFIGALVGVPIAFTLYSLWQLWRFDFSDSEARERRERAAGTGFWQAIKRFFLWLFGRLPAASRSDGAGQRVAPGGGEPPAWLEDLRDRPPAGSVISKAERVESLPRTSPMSNREDLRPLFGGDLPTADQAEFIDALQDSFSTMLEARGRGAGHVSPDLLLEGPLGSGRTSALIAAALHAVLVRGQRVLLLVPDDERAGIACRRIMHRVDAMHLTHHVVAERVTSNGVARWLTGEPLPEILIASLGDVEGHLFGSGTTQEPAFGRLSRLLQLLEVVLVDDLTEFDPRERSHLPFLLDKQRLLLESELLALQAVVCCPPLTRTARPILGRRLFAGGEFQSGRGCVELRQRETGGAWVVTVHADDPGPAVEELVRQCLARGLETVLLRPGIDELERERQHRRLTEREPDARLTILSHLDQAVGGALESVEVAFYHLALEEDPCLALNLFLGDEETVLVRVAARSQPDAPVPTRVTPILASRAAKPLQVAHLRSIGRFLAPATPVPLRVWGRFGVNPDDLPRVSLRSPPDLLYRLDLPPSDVPIEACAWVEGDARAAQPVRIERIAADTHRLLRDGATDAFFVGPPQPDARATEQRRAVWLDRETGRERAEEDLARVLAFQFRSEGNVYGANRLVKRGERVEIHEEDWHGNGYDKYLPVLKLQWQIPEPVSVESLMSSAEIGLGWYDLRLPASMPSAPDAEGTTRVSGSIVGLLDDLGRQSDVQSVSFEYEANVSLLLFDPPALDPHALSERVAGFVNGGWSTRDGDGRRFLPMLSCALGHATSVLTPGLNHFARLVAFAPGSQAADAPGAVVFVLEPATSGRTVMATLHRLLRDDEARGELLERARWCLTELAAANDPLPLLRRFARPAFSHGSAELDAAVALERVDAALKGAGPR